MNSAIKLHTSNDATVKRANVTVSGIEKFVSNGTRRIRGIASTDRLDLSGDIVEPDGGSWTLPLPLLWQHDHKAPIGWVQSVERVGRGLAIEAELSTGAGKADEVWELIEGKLLDSFSISFIGIKSEPLPGGGKRYLRWTLLECSIVAIPCNPDAKIQRGAVRLSRHGVGAIQLHSKNSHSGKLNGAVRLTSRGAIRLSKAKRHTENLKGAVRLSVETKR